MYHRYIAVFCRRENHLFILDDFLGSGRISSFESKPMELLKEGETKVIDRLRVSVNKSVDKCKNQLKFIADQLWQFSTIFWYVLLDIWMPEWMGFLRFEMKSDRYSMQQYTILYNILVSLSGFVQLKQKAKTDEKQKTSHIAIGMVIWEVFSGFMKRLNGWYAK